MKYSKGRINRVFTVRLEDGDVVHECIEALAEKEGIRTAAIIALGGADEGSRLVVGPKKGRGQAPIQPHLAALSGVHEVVGTGTIFPDEDGRALLHMHFSCGRGTETLTGCIREGVKTWHILEVIIFEIEGAEAVRKLNPGLGFRLLEPKGE